MNRKPPELHLIDGTTPMTGTPVMIPKDLRKRIPAAGWMDNPDAWNKKEFIEETATFLFDVYGIGNEQDKHILTMLADHIETYINCTKNIRENTLIVNYNNGSTCGPNPLVAIRNKTTTLIVQLMNELGLTPRGRLSASKVEGDSPVGKLMKGPKS